MDDEKVRTECVLLMAKLFSTQPALVIQYKTLFAAFINRFHDKSQKIRSYMIEFGRRFLSAGFGESVPIVEGLLIQ